MRLIKSFSKSLFLCILFVAYLFANDSDSSKQSRIYSFTYGVGTYELTNLGFQYQLSNRFSIGLSYINALTDSDFLIGDLGAGGSLKFSYYFDPSGINNFLFVNALNIEPSLVVRNSRKYYGVVASIGHESIVNRYLGFYWYLGIVNRIGNTRQVVFGSLKIGLHFDF